ncbi:unnamed protein product [Lampetra fluviatilis]
MPHREDTEAAGPRTRGAAARGGESGSSSPHPNEESGSSGTHTRSRWRSRGCEAGGPAPSPVRRGVRERRGTWGRSEDRAGGARGARVVGRRPLGTVAPRGWGSPGVRGPSVLGVQREGSCCYCSWRGGERRVGGGVHTHKGRGGFCCVCPRVTHDTRRSWHEVPAAREESSISPQLVPRPGARANPWRRQQCTPSELHTKPLYLLLHNAEEGKQLRQEKQHGGWGFFWVAYRENKLAHCQRARESSMFA